MTFEDRLEVKLLKNRVAELEADMKRLQQFIRDVRRDYGDHWTYVINSRAARLLQEENNEQLYRG